MSVGMSGQTRDECKTTACGLSAVVAWIASTAKETEPRSLHDYGRTIQVKKRNPSTVDMCIDMCMDTEIHTCIETCTEIPLTLSSQNYTRHLAPHRVQISTPNPQL